MDKRIGDREIVSSDAATPSRETSAPDQRAWVSRGFTWIEDIVYIGLGLLLGSSALFLLVSSGLSFVQGVLGGAFAGQETSGIISLLDQTLLVLMIVEILYTVQVSFREHVLAPEPFLIVALIAATRRILVLTAEFSRLEEIEAATFRNAMLELGLLTIMIVALVASLLMLRRRGPAAVAERDTER
jgi:uncharacterized membrane protein (DUF373 family)